MFETTFELETSMIRANAEKRGEKRGERRGEKRGEKRGRKLEKLETSKNLLAEGVPLELIVKATKLSQEQIKKYVGMQ